MEEINQHGIVSLSEVKIPLSNLIGKEGQGFKIAMQGLDGGRINIATCSIGTAQAALTAAQEYMNEREQFGKKIGQFQGPSIQIS